jgi:hypothetical protein
MATERPLRGKRAAWLNLVAGLLWLSIPLRNIFLPGFLGVSHHFHRPDPYLTSLWPIQAAAGILFLAASWKGFSNIRNNPEGKTAPAIRTLFGS